MKILVIGDTHGKLDKVRDIYPKLTDIDIIAHTGDHMRDGTALEKNWACLFLRERKLRRRLETAILK